MLTSFYILYLFFSVACRWKHGEYLCPARAEKNCLGPIPFVAPFHVIFGLRRVRHSVEFSSFVREFEQDVGAVGSGDIV